jgi:outer membrane protein TolC
MNAASRPVPADSWSRPGPTLALGLLVILSTLTAFAQEPSPTPTPPSLPTVLPLDAALEQALRNNLDLAIERITPRRAATNILAARAAFDPRFNLNTRYAENSSPRSAEQVAADGSTSVESRTFSTSAGVSQPTVLGTEIGVSANTTNRMNTFNSFEDEYTSFAGFNLRHPLLKNSGPSANRAQIRIATKGKEQSDATFLNRVDLIIADVHRAYYELLFALADYETKQRSLLLAERLQADNDARRELGSMTPLDVAQARSEAAFRLGDVIQAQLVIDQNRNRLLRLISRDFAAQRDQPLVPTDILTLPEPAPPGEFDLRLGLENRKDYLALLKQAEADGLRVQFARNQLLPRLDLEGSYGFNGLDRTLDQSFNRVADTRDPGWFIGLAVEIPWGNQSEKARLLDAKLQKEQNLLRLKNTEQQIFLEVDNAAKAVESARRQYETNRIARAISDQTAEAEEEKLKAGISTSYTVLQLQRDAATARTQELRSLTNYHTALVNLRLAQGILAPLSGVVVEPPPADAQSP